MAHSLSGKLSDQRQSGSPKSMWAIIVLAGLLTLALLPQTGWLVRMQWASVLGGGNFNWTAQWPSRRQPSSLSDDVRVQIADAVAGAAKRYHATVLDPRVQAMHDLAKQYPSDPAIYGTAVLYAMSGSVFCNRSAEESVLAYKNANAQAYFENKPKSASPEALAAFDSDCLAGERLAPDNAYFYAFRSLGLFAQHRDKEAIAELLTAGNKPVYREYWTGEVAGRLRESEARIGGRECIARTWIYYSTLFPHLSKIRDLARLSVAMAIRDEQRGNFEHGLVIRRACRRLGGLMRYSSTSLIANLVGIAIAGTSGTKPDGATPSGYDKMTSDQKDQSKASAYIAYLHGIGHPEEAAAFNAERQAGLQVKSITNRGSTLTQSDMKRLVYVAILWLTSCLLIWNLFASILFGLIARLAGRTSAIRTGAGLSPGGAATFLRIVATVLIVIALGGTKHWLAHGVILTIQNLNMFPPDCEADEIHWTSLLYRLISIVYVCPAPMFVALGACLFLRHGRPRSVAVVSALRKSALPLVCVLAVSYAIIVCFTVRLEETANRHMDRTLLHEGRYYATELHMPWPPPVE